MSSENKVLESIKTRRSIRKYKPDMVPKEIIDQIVEAGTYAATGMNRQSPIIIAVTNKEMRDRLSRMNAAIMGVDSDPFYGAPVVLIVLADRSSANYLYDGSLVMGNLMLAAHSLGVGSCWIHRAKQEFESPEGKEIMKSWESREIMRESDTASSAMWTAIIPRRRSGRTTGYIILTDIRRTLKVRKNGKGNGGL